MRDTEDDQKQRECTAEKDKPQNRQLKHDSTKT